MSKFRESNITDLGLKYAREAANGVIKITFTRAVLSSDQHQNDSLQTLQGLTTLNGFVSADPINYATQSSDSNVVLPLRFHNTNLTTDNYINTVGLYATDGTTEVLYSVIINDDPDLFPAYNGTTPESVKINYETQVGRADQVNVEVSPLGMATEEEIQSLSANIQSASSATQALSSGTSSNVSSLSNAISSVASAAGSNSAITSSFATIQNSVNANSSNIAIIESSVASNSSNISINSSNIAVNSSNISTLQTSVSSNASSIASGNSQMVSLQNQVNGVLARQSAIIQQLVTNTGVSADSLVSTLVSSGSLAYNYGIGTGTGVSISFQPEIESGTITFNYYPSVKVLIVSGNNIIIGSGQNYTLSYFYLSKYINQLGWTATPLNNQANLYTLTSTNNYIIPDTFSVNNSSGNISNLYAMFKINF